MADFDNKNVKDLEIGIVGGGSMGQGMSLLFSEHGSNVGTYDKLDSATKGTLDNAAKAESVPTDKVHGFSDLSLLLDAFPKDDRRIIVFSLPHGSTVDTVLAEIGPKMKQGDVILDGGNEWWESTERRQKKALEEWGIHYIGMGVSGGYQAARHGPSISPSGTEEAYKLVEGFLNKWAAKTADGQSCVGLIGPGGSGHYVKMVHNGIEQAHLSILCEVRSLLHLQLGYNDLQVADIFERWSAPRSTASSNGDANGHGLSGNYLIDIGYKSLRFRKGDGIDVSKGVGVEKEEQGKAGETVVEGIEDKVTQDVDNSEGTGVWTTSEIAIRHVAAPAIAAAHQLRVISADKTERLHVIKNFDVPVSSPASFKDDAEKCGAFVETLRQATYGAILGAFVQGLGIIARASIDRKWNVSLAECIRIWRAGCIIQSDAIADFLAPLLHRHTEAHNLLLIPEIGRELSKTYGSLKKVAMLLVETDAVAPAVSATLEWMKAIGARDLPTDFEEMELDYFGHHNYDTKTEHLEGTEKGKHHTEFAPA